MSGTNEEAKKKAKELMEFIRNRPAGSAGICKFCKLEKNALCEHGFCIWCGCKEYCWLD